MWRAIFLSDEEELRARHQCAMSETKMIASVLFSVGLSKHFAPAFIASSQCHSLPQITNDAYGWRNDGSVLIPRKSARSTH